MIILVTNRRDLTTDFVVAELARRKQRFVRFNTDTAELTGLSFRLRGGSAHWSIEREGSILDAAEFRAGYFRRPVIPSVAGTSDASFRRQVEGEWAAMLSAFYASLRCRWLNSPLAIAQAENKPRQLTVAAKIGFDIPETLIGNTFDQVRSFVHPVPAIAKPLRSGRMTEGETELVSFTSRVDDISLADRPSIELSPVIYQREVTRSRDVRVTVVDGRLFACEISASDAGVVDWRTVNPANLSYSPVELPTSVSDRCLALTRELDLRFGAIDLIVDRRGTYWFLEINPNGQWAWIERRSGLPISSAIVDTLVSDAACV